MNVTVYIMHNDLLLFEVILCHVCLGHEANQEYIILCLEESTKRQLSRVLNIGRSIINKATNG